LKRDIAEFSLVPGDRLTENEISVRLGVSRTPVRPALVRLQQEGYVEVLFRSGWRVLPFDFEQFEQLYDLRMVLETTAAQRLCADTGRVDSALLEQLSPSGWCPPPDAAPTWRRFRSGTRNSTAPWWPPPAIPRWHAATAT
jgi:DNA-binding FadR family transcriptional regulator